MFVLSKRWDVLKKKYRHNSFEMYINYYLKSCRMYNDSIVSLENKQVEKVLNNTWRKVI